MAIKDRLPKHLIKSLDLENYDIIRIISLGDMYPVIVMRDKRADSQNHWCVQHRGYGQYFKTLNEVQNYLVERNWIVAS